jgi:hypothetical protein
VWKTRKPRGCPINKAVPRFQAERAFAWFPRKYRRLVVRWDRMAACFKAFLAMARIHIWAHRLIVG